MIVECAYCHATIDTEADDYFYDPEQKVYFDTSDCVTQDLFQRDKLDIYENGKFWLEGYRGFDEEEKPEEDY